jgi:hypothetical protein
LLSLPQDVVPPKEIAQRRDEDDEADGDYKRNADRHSSGRSLRLSFVRAGGTMIVCSLPSTSYL